MENGYDFDYHYDWLDFMKTQYSIDTSITPQIRHKNDVYLDEDSKEYNVIADNKIELNKGEQLEASNTKDKKRGNILPEKTEQFINEQSPTNIKTRPRSASKPIYNEPPSKTNEKRDFSERFKTLNVVTPKISKMESTTKDDSPKKLTVAPDTLAKNMSFDSANSSKNMNLDLIDAVVEEEIPPEISMNDSRRWTQVGKVKQFSIKNKESLFRGSEDNLLSNPNLDDSPTRSKVLHKNRTKTRTFVQSDFKDIKLSSFANYSIFESKQMMTKHLTDQKLDLEEDGSSIINLA